jgi:hypothetical protein
VRELEVRRFEYRDRPRFRGDPSLTPA